jgi:hypothetical protein
MDDRTIELSAKLYVDEYGSEAPTMAAQNVETLRNRGDMDGAADWRRVVKEINRQLRADGG